MHKLMLFVVGVLMLTMCISKVNAQGTYQNQPELKVRTVMVLHHEGLLFKDLGDCAKFGPDIDLVYEPI